MYLEASAMLPQIYMFQKQAATEGGAVEVHVDDFRIVDVTLFVASFPSGFARTYCVCTRIFSNFWANLLDE